MKLNIANPIAGTQKCIEIDDDKKYSVFFDHRMGHEVEVSQLGDDFKGYVVKITGGNDKDGFPMKQGVIVKGRVRLLMSKGHKTYRPRRSGERKRKSVRGCIVGPDIAALSLVVVKKGEKDIEGLTTETKPRRLGPKRVNKIKKLFAMTKKDSIALVKKSIVRRDVTNANGKKHVKAPRIQRLVTDARLRRKKQYRLAKKQRWRTSIEARQNYIKMLQNLKKLKEKKEGKKEEEKKPVEAKKTDKKAEEKKPVEKKKAEEKKKEVKKEVKKDTKKATKK